MNAQLHSFLIEMALASRERVKNISEFLTKAEKKILTEFANVDNLTMAEMGTLAKSVGQLQGIFIDILELMRKVSMNDTPLSGNIEMEEIAYELVSMDHEELEALKVAMVQIKRKKLAKKALVGEESEEVSFRKIASRNVEEDALPEAPEAPEAPVKELYEE